MTTRAFDILFKAIVVTLLVPVVSAQDSTAPTSDAAFTPSISPAWSVATNAPQAEFGLSSAFDGANFLVGIRGAAGNPDTVGAQVLSPTGARVGSLIETGRVMDGFLDGPRVAMGSANYLMVWTDASSQHRLTGNDIYAQFISPAGDLVGSPFVVTKASGDQYARGVAHDGTRFLVIWAAGNGVRGRRVSATGELLGNEIVFTTQDVEEPAAVACGGGLCLVVWVEGSDGAHATKGRLLSASGELGPAFVVSQNDSYHFNPLSVAYGGGRFMVVWSHNAGEDDDWDLRGRVVLPDGTFGGGEIALAAEASEEIIWANNVVFDGKDFLVVWTDYAGSPATATGTVFGRYWSQDGVPAGVPFIIEPAAPGVLGVGLSAADRQVLAVVNRNAFDSASDVWARFIQPPSANPFVQILKIASDPQEASKVQVTFEGILQSSPDSKTWTDLAPQPTSPWILEAGEGVLFFRARD
ncbi:MAG TPA: hypothetical protein PK640_03365 [Verrucomicrobiota bacterium]|nr:hypothetical protein [Verrucomicrobiota bacterium]